MVAASTSPFAEASGAMRSFAAASGSVECGQVLSDQDPAPIGGTLLA